VIQALPPAERAYFTHCGNEIANDFANRLQNPGSLEIADLLGAIYENLIRHIRYAQEPQLVRLAWMRKGGFVGDAEN